MQIASIQDNRRGWTLFKRHQLWAIADLEGIEYPPSATSDVMIQLLNLKGIPSGKYGYCLQKDYLNGNGSTIVQNHFPKKKPVNQPEAVSITDLQKQIEELQKQNEALMAHTPSASQEAPAYSEPKPTEVKNDYSQCKHFELKRLCKERGIATERTDKSTMLIKKLEANDGNTA